MTAFGNFNVYLKKIYGKFLKFEKLKGLEGYFKHTILVNK